MSPQRGSTWYGIARDRWEEKDRKENMKDERYQKQAEEQARLP